MAKTIQVHLKDLTTKFDVRKKLDDSHVMNLAYLYEAGETLPPLLITKQMQIIDGRHRKTAMELAGRQVADCIFTTEESEGEMVIQAIKANVGGALPPTKADIVHSIILLLNQGWTERKIIDSMPFPRSVGRKYAKDAWGFILEQKLRVAMKSIAEDGMTVKAASDKFGVPVEKLQEHMNPSRKKEKQKGIAWRKHHISRAYQGFGKKISHEIQRVVMDYEDNALTEEEALGLFEHIFELIKKSEKRIEEHRERFGNLAREMRKVSEIPA